MRPELGFALTSICLVVWASGCIVQTEPPAPVVVEFVNQTSLDVQPNFYVSASATTMATLFVAANLDTSFINRPFPEMRAGETASVSLACDEVASFGVSRPESFDAISITVVVSDDQVFLARDQEYTCGTTVRFVYFTEGETLRVRAEFPQ